MLSTIQDRSRLAGGADNRWEVMTRLYQDKLTELVSTLDLGQGLAVKLSVRQFFNGAALYAGDAMCASWSPVGLAFRLPAKQVSELIDGGQAIPLKYFAKGHIKKGYALFENPADKDSSTLKEYFLQAIAQADAGA